MSWREAYFFFLFQWESSELFLITESLISSMSHASQEVTSVLGKHLAQASLGTSGSKGNHWQDSCGRVGLTWVGRLDLLSGSLREPAVWLNLCAATCLISTQTPWILSLPVFPKVWQVWQELQILYHPRMNLKNIYTEYLDLLIHMTWVYCC